MKMDKKANTTYTYSFTDMTERDVRVLLVAVQHEIREVNKVLQVASRSASRSSLSTNDVRKKRLSDKREEYEVMRKALFAVLGIDEDDEEEDEDED